MSVTAMEMGYKGATEGKLDRTPGGGLRLRLPATSANLGPGFDTLALALTLGLEIDAVPSTEFRVTATGRNPEVCSEMRRNLLLDVYGKTLAANGARPAPLSLCIHNDIPIGMGCGSSAAVRWAGVLLANHFGELGWSGDRLLSEVSRLEGHPDNAAACWLGGLAVATSEAGKVHAVRILPTGAWRVLLVLPDQPLATTAARSVLPSSYERADAVFNIQRASLLATAFSTGRGDLLRIAMQDRLHQPYRGKICPLLPRLLPLAGESGILGVALSGAGPSVLLLVDEGWPMETIRALVLARLESGFAVEMLECGIESSSASVSAVEVGSMGD